MSHLLSSLQFFILMDISDTGISKCFFSLSQFFMQSGLLSTIDDSPSSAERLNSQRRRARCYKEPTFPSSLVHIQTATSLHLHINTFRSHDSSSHRTVHHKRVTFHCSVTHSLWLKTDVKHECGQLSLARALLNTQGRGRYTGIPVGEAQNPGPATHERDWTVAEQPDATH